MGAHDLSEEEHEKIREEWRERQASLQRGAMALRNRPEGPNRDAELVKQKTRRRGGFQPDDYD